MKRLLGPLIVGLAFMIFAGGLPAAEPQTAAAPSAFVPQPQYEFAPVIDGQDVAHDFIIQNKGNAPLTIERVKTD